MTTTAPFGRSYTVSSNTQTITWHPYPQEKPTRRGQYIVTALDPNTNEPYVIVCRWDRTNYGNYDWAVVNVIEWAELPKAYERV